MAQNRKRAHRRAADAGEPPAPGAPAAPAAAAGKSSSKARKRGSKGASGGGSSVVPWAAAAPGWRTVDVNDELVLGADEFGFAGLEVLEDTSVLDPELMARLDEAARQQQQQLEGDRPAPKGKKGAAAAKAQQQQQQKGAAGSKKRTHAAAAAADGGSEDVGALKARLQQLEAENRALKKHKKQQQPAPQQTKHQQQKQQQAAAAAAATDGSGERSRRQLPEQQKERRRAAKEAAKEAVRQQRQLERQQREQKQQQQQQAAAAATASVPAAASADVDMTAWQRFELHPDLLAALAAQGFVAPTPIQDAVLEPAIRDRRDVIGAAQTGSGKTLAFGLPILQVLLQEREQQLLQQELAGGDAAAAADGGSDGSSKQQKGPLRALILTPTRELALQVCDHLQALGKRVGIRAVALVGGIAPVKQERLLRGCPPIVVATPGRLWDLITHGQQHVAHLERLSFFVLDEADRMVQQGHYQELSSLLDMLPTAERAAAIAASADVSAAAAAEADETAAAVDAYEQQRALQKQQGRCQQQQVQGANGEGEDAAAADEEGPDDAPQASEDEGEEAAAAGGSSDGSSDSSGDESGSEGEEAEEGGDEDEQQEREHGTKQQQQRAAAGGGRGKPPRGKHHLLQTFVFSATLTLPAELHKRLRRGGGGSSGAASLESLMDRLSFRPRPAVVDLSPSTRLAERVSEGVVHALEPERDAVLYYLLARHPGRALVFVNAVSAVRRLSALLQLLGLPAVALHAQQQQRQRLKALDRFKAAPHGVLVATDVAARGLDVQDVQMVVHYQLPASADTYIHRSGRTARTGGSDGAVLSLVTPGDASRWAALRRSLEGQTVPPAFPIDDRVLMVAKQRVALAAKIDSVQRADRKQHAESSWARNNADAMGIELSDDSDGGEQQADLNRTALKAAGSSRRSRRRGGGGAAAAADPDSQAGAAGMAGARKLAAALAGLQQQLNAALTVPLQPSISTKYFTGGLSRGAAAAAAAAAAGGAGGVGGGATSAPGGAADTAAGAPGSEDVSKPGSVLPAAVIAETMQLASRLRDSKAGRVAAAGGSGASLLTGAAGNGSQQQPSQAGRADDGSRARRKLAAAAAAAAASKAALLPGRKRGRGKRGAAGGGTGVAGGMAKPTGLARLLMSRNEIKRQKKQQGMFVVRTSGGGGGVFGRDAQGASALSVLNAAVAAGRGLTNVGSRVVSHDMQHANNVTRMRHY